MNYIKTAIPGIWLLEPKVFDDSRGYFMETYKRMDFEKHIGSVAFMQDNESCSVKGVLRGLHYQLAPHSQAKLVRVIQGTVLDVAVDIRRHSPTFGKAFAIELSGENKLQLFIPQGFAHGFHVLSETAVFTYKVDHPYAPACERGIRFDDPAIGIDWKQTGQEALTLSEKDLKLPLLKDAELNFEYNGVMQ
ncbi:MAG: dTDP-4-dehydrorhamnose 3,5-epimerase [Tannerella sp.]|jgi:dTDP-4-dehydrorhamnose 3,5-epimerase|nr:dTDP-4-dehydrorhamnose 3,5-epimerase [Tannerella sp.]